MFGLQRRLIHACKDQTKLSDSPTQGSPKLERTSSEELDPALRRGEGVVRGNMFGFEDSPDRAEVRAENSRNAEGFLRDLQARVLQSEAHLRESQLHCANLEQRMVVLSADHTRSRQWESGLCRLLEDAMQEKQKFRRNLEEMSTELQNARNTVDDVRRITGERSRGMC